MPVQPLPIAPPTAAAPPVLLAPMAGITDRPFRKVVAGFGAALVVSEMVASRDMVQASPLAAARAELDLCDTCTAVQLAGCDPYWMAEAARRLAAAGARAIDINMGCPAKKVTGGQAGAALMRDPDHALRLIGAVAGAVDVPVTLKTRLGWDAGAHTAPALARRAAKAGVAMVTVHGRTRCQFYKGHADWAAIAPVVAAAGVPVIANGDIAGAGDARRALTRSGGAGVMVGRAAQGRPWLPAQIGAALAGRAVPRAPSGAALVDLVGAHYEAMLAFYGRALGVRVARKHLGWYADAAGGCPAIRRAVLPLDDPRAVLARIPDLVAPAATPVQAA